MTATERDRLLRLYADGGIGWSALRARGFDSYAGLLAALGARGLRPPIAPMDGPNTEVRERGLAMLREALRQTG